MDDPGATGDLEPEEAVAEGDLAELLSLKEGATFIVADAWGDVRGGASGLFGDGTRLLSRFRLLIGDKRPSRLNYGLSRDSAVFTFNGANLALPPMGGPTIPRGVIHLERKRCLGGGRLHERLRLTNYGLERVMAPVSFDFEVDFRDIFEVRGMRRPAHGQAAPPSVDGRGVAFAYDGLDGVRRESEVVFSEPPWRLTPERADFMFSLAPGAVLDLYLEAGPPERETPSARRFDRVIEEARRASEAFKIQGACLHAGDGAFDAWLEQSRADVAALTTTLPTGPYPFAGIPWFSTPFGRDGIITAWQMLWLDPSLAKGVLSYLASRQADHASAFDDSAPGKIMHETRGGEMAALKEIPFGLYYGGVDTTPLFIALAGAYLHRTGDRDTIRSLWPALLKATEWLDRNADANPEGFIDYDRGADSGLSNQGWKDSLDSVFHDDGRFATGPIALVEVQGYAFAAWRAMSQMAVGPRWSPARQDGRRGPRRCGRRWRRGSGSPTHGFYALAIDGAGPRLRAEVIQPWSPAVRGTGQRPARAARDRDADVAGVRQRLGRAHHGGGGQPLQSNVLSQRLDLAARHGDRGDGHVALWRARGTGENPRRHVRGVARLPQSHAGAAVRLRAGGRGAADRLSGGLHAPGLGGRIDLHDDAGLPRPHHRRRAQGGAPGAARAAGRRRSAYPGPTADRGRLRRSDVPARRRRHRGGSRPALGPLRRRDPGGLTA